MSDTDLTPEEWLAHYGVKGMRWGHRKAPDAVGAASNRPKVTSKDIHDARERTAVRRRAINAQVDKVNAAAANGASKREFTKEAKTLEKMSVDFLKNPDRATALRMTTGERVAAGIIAVALPGGGTAGVAAGAAIRVAVRKHLEKDVQAAQNGKYDPQKK